MAIAKKIQFLRNGTAYASRTDAVTAINNAVSGSSTSASIVDGQPILARYTLDSSVITILGIVHKGVSNKTGVTLYEDSSVINQFIIDTNTALAGKVSTATTISAGTGLTGGGNLSQNRTISHASITAPTPASSSATLSHGGTFKALTNIAEDGLGHVTAATATTFTLPSDNDTKVSQAKYTGSDYTPILIKNNTTTVTTADTVSFSSGATIDKSGNIKAASVSAATMTATTFSGKASSAGTADAAPWSGITGKPTLITGYSGIAASDGLSAASASSVVTIKHGTAHTASGQTSGDATHVANVKYDKYGHVTATSTTAIATASTSQAGLVKLADSTGSGADSTSIVMTQSAVTQAINNAIADVADALIYKGTIAGTATSPGAQLPAGNKGDVYKVSTAGYVGGNKVEVGDMLICNTDGTAAGTNANWDVIQTNIDTATTSAFGTIKIATTTGASTDSVMTQKAASDAFAKTGTTVTGSGYLGGGGNLGSNQTITHNATALGSGTTSPNAAQNPTFGGTFNIPVVSYDGAGHVTAVTTTTVKIPASSSTWTSDVNVNQKSATTNVYNILAKGTTGTATASTGTNYSTGVSINMATKIVNAAGYSATTAAIADFSNTGTTPGILLADGTNTDCIDCGTYDAR